MPELSTDVLVVGAGPAGIAAAVSAERAGAGALLLDMQPEPGGQIWRGQWRARTDAHARRWLNALEASPAQRLMGARLIAVPQPGAAIAQHAAGAVKVRYDRVIVATGARELLLPFPGWTLPGVFGAGGLQALAKNGWPVSGKRIVVAGSGALLLAVADTLRSHGAHVVAMVEQARRRAQWPLAGALARSPRRLAQALGYAARLRAVPRLTSSWIERADGGDAVTQVSVRTPRGVRRIDCDHLAIGYGLLPNLDVAAAFGCTLRDGVAWVDANQHSSVGGVYCAGESTGIGGVEQSVAEGEIAGCAAAGRLELAAGALARRERARRFAGAHAKSFALRDELRALAVDDTVLCRCEDVSFGDVRACASQRDAKLQTRFAMGHCQGRICGAAASFLFDWSGNPPRPPLAPVPIADLDFSAYSTSVNEDSP